jgi:hypothetical protein
LVKLSPIQLGLNLLDRQTLADDLADSAQLEFMYVVHGKVLVIRDETAIQSPFPVKSWHIINNARTRARARR